VTASNGRAGRAGIFSWMLFDWAAQPFHTLIITFIFAPYFVAHVATTPAEGQQVWGLATGLAGLAVAVLAPILGAIADRSGARKPWLAAFSVPAILGAAMLWIAVPGTDAPYWPVLLAFAVGLIGIEFAAIFNNAMMPGLVPRKDLGKLSGSGWALGYAGGLLILIAVLLLFSASAETGKTLAGLSPILGLDPSTHEGDRATGPLAAVWYFVFIIPLFLFTPDQPKRKGGGQAVREGLAKLWTTLRGLSRRRSYTAFLVSSMIYRDGLNALYAFGGIYAAGVLGLSIIEIGVFGILAALAGTFGAFFGGRADARFGPRRVVMTTCWVLALTCLVVVSTTPDAVLFVIPATGTSLPLIVFYVAGALIGAAGGALQAASRTLLVDQVEDGEAGEAFGLYALTGRATAFIGPLLIALVTAMTSSQRIGVSPIVVLLALGALGLIWVKDRVER
jgi:UMF1 family MFS transporter